jgi:hypothetical protein
MNLTSRIRERETCSCILGWGHCTGICEQGIELTGYKISGISLLASKMANVLI